MHVFGYNARVAGWNTAQVDTTVFCAYYVREVSDLLGFLLLGFRSNDLWGGVTPNLEDFPKVEIL